MAEEIQEIQTVETTPTIANITAAPAGAMVTSLKSNPGDRAAASRMYNAMNNPSERLSDHINEIIEIQDYLIEMTDIEDTDNQGNGLGTISKVPRVVLVSPDGTAYQAVSVGIANSIRNLCVVCGNAPWKPAVQLKVKQIPTKRGSMLTVDMVG